jgi:hypothetical protein
VCVCINSALVRGVWQSSERAGAAAITMAG